MNYNANNSLPLTRGYDEFDDLFRIAVGASALMTREAAFMGGYLHPVANMFQGIIHNGLNAYKVLAWLRDFVAANPDHGATATELNQSLAKPGDPYSVNTTPDSSVTDPNQIGGPNDQDSWNANSPKMQQCYKANPNMAPAAPAALQRPVLLQSLSARRRE